MGTDGSVAYLFTRLGVINYARSRRRAGYGHSLEVGAEDIQSDEEGGITVTTPWEKLGHCTGLTEAGLPPDRPEVTMMASNTSDCDVEQAQKVLKLIDAGRLRRCSGGLQQWPIP